MISHDEQLQTRILSQDLQERERTRRIRGVLTELSLHDENRLYANTRGISGNNGSLGFRPGYLNRLSGEWVLSRFSDGKLAPIHVLDGLPESWVDARDANGRVVAARAEVVTGFIRDSRFYTRDEAIRATTH